MQKSELIQYISEAIAIMEGFMKIDPNDPTQFVSRPETIAYRHNNPGNIRLWGKYPRERGYVKFPTDDTGWAALYKQVDKNIGRKLTLREFFGGKPGVYAGYAPSTDGNHPIKYAEFVSSYLRGKSAIFQGIDQLLEGIVDDDTTPPL